MINILEEVVPDNLNVTTKMKVTGNCRTYEDYNEDEESSLYFEMEVSDDNITSELTKMQDEIGEELSPAQKIKFEEVTITDANFALEDDCNSGEFEITCVIKSEKEISDEDLKYIAEICVEPMADRLSANVTGTVTYESTPYSFGDGITTQEVTREVNETAHISEVTSNIDFKRVDI